MVEVFLDMFGSSKLLDVDDFVKLFMRFALNLTAVWLVVRVIYVRLYRWNEHVFTYFAFNIVTFSVCLMLRKVPIEIGFALGLFAVFGILRYRTEPIKIRDLTYLFVVIGLAILNAVANKKVSFLEVIAINSVIVGSTYVLEVRNRDQRREWKTVEYDRLELIHPSRRAELIADLEERVGIKVVGVEVERADLLRDTARLRVECTVEDDWNGGGA